MNFKRLLFLSPAVFVLACSAASPGDVDTDQGAVHVAEPRPAACAQLDTLKAVAEQVAKDEVALETYRANLRAAAASGRPEPEVPSIKTCDPVPGHASAVYTRGSLGDLAVEAAKACPAPTAAITSDPALAKARSLLEGTLALAVAAGELDATGRNLKAVLDRGVTLHHAGMGVFGTVERRVFKAGKVAVEKLDVDVDTGRVGEWKRGEAVDFRVEGKAVIIGAERFELRFDAGAWLEKLGGDPGSSLYDAPSECEA